MLRGRRLSAKVWLVIGVIILVNLLALLDIFKRPTVARLDTTMIQILYFAGSGLVEGLMLVAFGLLAVRQHGLLALLVVIGGYSYMLMDSDYISGFRLTEWAGYISYALSMIILYLVVTPVALLRARTRLGRALAVFVPVGIFHFARIAVPILVLPGTHQMPWGDILLSVNVMLSMFLAWFLYSDIYEAAHGEEMVSVVSYPPQSTLSGNHS